MKIEIIQKTTSKIKKLIFLFLFIVSLSFAFSIEGAGTQNSPFEITNCLELQDVNNDISAYYVLTQDVDCSDTVNWNNGAGFEPIGSLVNNFTGNFDGQNFIISDLFINRSSESAVGLFSAANTYESTISNVGLEDVEIYGEDYVGGLVGYGNLATYTNNSVSGNVSGSGSFVGGLVGNGGLATFTNNSATGVIVSGFDYVGGLVGTGQTATFTNNSATGSVNGSDERVGGLVGHGQAATFTNNYATGSVNGKNRVGGLVGYGFSATFTNNYATGSVNGSDERVGGLVGYGYLATFTNNSATGSVSGNGYTGGLVGDGGSTFTNNSATGSVSGSYFVGGLVGYGYSATFTNNYATGSVNGSSNTVGGLVGYGEIATFTNNYATGSVNGDYDVGGLVGIGLTATFTNNYATGNVSGNNQVGGLVGNGTCSSATQSYYDTETTGQTSSSCGVGKTTTELQTPEDASGIYSSWNSDIWNFGSSAEYPIFKYQGSDQGAVINLQITTCEQLQNMNQDLSNDYVLIGDIDCSETVNWNNGAGFIPIGNSTNKFNGSFDGKNFTISNLFINRSSETHVGLFSYVDFAVGIKNVGLENVEVYGNGNVGGLVGNGKDGIFTNNYATGNVNGVGNVGMLAGSGELATFTNNYATGNVNGTQDSIGGLVGRGNSATFTNNSVTGSVNGDQFVGGLVGFGQGFLTTFTNNYATGSVVGKGNYVGGLVGDGDSATFTNNYATGNVNGSGRVGGLVGDGDSATFTNNYATGSVSGKDIYVGGLVGRGNSATFTNNYATGNVNGSERVGGFLGYGETVTFTSNYATGSVNGSSDVGGLVGDGGCSSETQSYYDTQTTGQTTSECGTGKTTQELQNPTTNTGIYSTWDSNIWKFGTSTEYPNFEQSTVDTTSPEINIISPNNEAILNTNFVEINFSVTDTNLNISSVMIEFNNTNLTPTQNGDNFNYAISNLENGDYNFIIHAQDDAGNENFVDRNFTINVTSPTPSTTSSSKGGSSSPEKYTTKLKDLETSSTTHLGVREELSIKDEGRTIWEVVLNKADAIKAEVEINGERKILSIGYKENLDIDSDGKKDYKVSLTGIRNSQVSFSISKIIAETQQTQQQNQTPQTQIEKQTQQQQNQTPQTQVENQTPQVENQTQAPPGEQIVADETTSSKVWVFLGAITLLVLLGLSGHTYYKKVYQIKRKK